MLGMGGKEIAIQKMIQQVFFNIIDGVNMIRTQ